MPTDATELEVIFDGSTNPGTVLFCGRKLSFESDTEAKWVFDRLNRLKDNIVRWRRLVREARDRANSLDRVLGLAEDVSP